jgi:hypothetical protein
VFVQLIGSRPTALRMYYGTTGHIHIHRSKNGWCAHDDDRDPDSHR